MINWINGFNAGNKKEKYYLNKYVDFDAKSKPALNIASNI